MLNNPEQSLENLPPEEREEAIAAQLDKESEHNTLLTDRNLDTYCNEFGFLPEDLRGQKILDVGSGEKETFSKEAGQYGAKVYSVNPRLLFKEVRNMAKGKILKSDKKTVWQRRSIGARAQELPLQDESFDMVTSLYAIPYYIDSKEGKLSAIKEMVRVLKPGGRILIAPNAVDDEKDPNEKTTKLLGERTIAWLKENYYDLELPKGNGPIVIKKKE